MIPRARVTGGVLLCLAGAALFGCGDEVRVVRSSAPGSASAASSSSAPLAGKVGPAPAKVEISEAEFVESDRSRDPFRSFARKFAEETRGRERSQRDVVLSQYGVDELKLIGIVTRIQPAKAMLVDPTGRGHVIQRGQFVGRADLVQTGGRSGATYEINWRVDRIREGDVVLVREDPSNPDVPSATKVIPLRVEGTQIVGSP